MGEGNLSVFEHEFWMRRCLALAERGRGRVSPNPMVGSVLVRGGVVLAEGWHDVFGGAHAERMLFEGLGDAGDLGDCVLYVSLEPCSHFGKTPPCANLILERGVGTVVVGVLDPNPMVSGRGVELLRIAGVEVIVGVLEAECRNLNWSFWVNQRLGRAAVLAKWAETGDGYMGSGTSERVKISGTDASAWVMEQRKGMDAILVGVNTWNLDRPRLNVRGLGVERQPVRIVLDRGGRGVYEDGVDVGDVGPLWVVDGAMGIVDLLQWLYVEKGLGVVMVEGGAQVLAAFFAADCVDQVHVLRNARMVLGAGVKSPSTGNLELRREDDLGEDEHWVWERDLA
jgi:diaminohydroxyphosphoribosylaminopyrimidine deaminase/5-amino-6-(5-phosphoribosylamino)uracil reductase